MKIVFFVHPVFLESQSMPRFAEMLANGMERRGHSVQIWSPIPRFWKLGIINVGFKKWGGYIDQFFIFPNEVRQRLRDCPRNTLFVFSDHALGPWVPLVAHLPHVIHCHDFLAQQSALNKIPENKTSWTGKQYQAYIRKGYLKGKNFISVSKNTQLELHRFLDRPFMRSLVVYNGLNQSFHVRPFAGARKLLGKQLNLDLENGYFLHVGGNQWYKNREGVIEIYDAWRSLTSLDLPLLMIGKAPNEELIDRLSKLKYKASIHWLTNMDDEQVKLAYNGSVAFLFPSLAEGFGWPIAEAMASGCPVITTNEAPMTEVAGEAAFLIDRRPADNELAEGWAMESAKMLNEVVKLSEEERKIVVEKGLVNAKKFNADNALDAIEAIYKEVLQSSAGK